MMQSSDYPIRRTRALIDLDALDQNLTQLSARAAKLMPAVKANGYGHGAIAIAKGCERWGVEMLGVANLDEYLILRDHGITTPILIFEELFADELETAIREAAVLTVASIEFAHRVSEAATRLQSHAVVHINMDTGMGRMGLYVPELATKLTPDLPQTMSAKHTTNTIQPILEISALPGLRVEGLYTHFPAAQDTQFSFAQIAAMDELVQKLRSKGCNIRYRHIANSAALLAFPQEIAACQLSNLARPGIAMYGLYPTTNHKIAADGIAIKPLMKLTSSLIKITRYAQKWSIGYERSYWAKAGSLIGIAPLGYGDGFRRTLSNRGEALVHGMRVPIAGRISMDMIALDLSKMPETVHIDDEVVFLGEQEWNPAKNQMATRSATIEAGELARLCDTIPYEITCALTSRIPRIYLRAGKIVATENAREGYREYANGPYR